MLACVAEVSDRTHLKILSPNQMPQRLPVVLAQVKSGKTFKNLLKEIHRIIHFLYRAKEIIRKIYNNMISSIKL